MNGKVKLCSDEVGDSDCHKARHELKMKDGWSLEGGIVAFAKNKGAVCLAAMVITQPWVCRG